MPAGEPYDNDWKWVGVQGSQCRDGSQAGYYYREGTAKKLMIFLNGGGACADPFFCGLNPVNVDQDLPIEILLAGTINLLIGPDPVRQQAPEEGIFKRNEPRNPVTDWSMVFVPYCTGDIHSGVRTNVEVPDVAGMQQFVGYTNFGLFLDSFGAHFQDVDQVLLTGSSAGGFGSLFNYDRTQEFFNEWDIPVTAISDSGIPFRDEFMAPCLQKKWRTYWGLNQILPEECTECFAEDGSGLVEAYGNWLFHEKYKDNALGGFISTKHDQIIRAFFAPGLNAESGQPDNCSLEPGGNTIFSALGLGNYDGAKFEAGLKDVMDNVVGRDTVGFYVWEDETHMHLWRPRFFETNGNSMSIADWVKDILDGKKTQQGTL